MKLISVSLATVFLASSAVAATSPMVFINKQITSIRITNDNANVEVGIETGGEICGALPGSSEVKCSKLSQLALVAEGPNKAYMVQLLVSAYTSKSPVSVEMTSIPNGGVSTTTITSVTAARPL